MIAWFNLLFGLLTLNIIPTTLMMWNDSSFERQLSPAIFFVSLLPMIILSLFYIVTAVTLFKHLSGSRIMAVVASISQVIIGIISLGEVFNGHGIKSVSWYSLSVIIIGGLNFYYLNKPAVKTYLRENS